MNPPSFSPLPLPLLLLLLILFPPTSLAHPAQRIQGVVFSAGGWSSPLPSTTLSSASADAVLARIAATGATHIRLLVTVYQPYINSTTIGPKTDPHSPLRTETDAELLHAIHTAAGLNLSVALAPILDPDWDIASNRRADPPYPGAACLLSPNASCPGEFVWRGQIGRSFSPAEWGAWFASYSAQVLHYAALSEQSGHVQLFMVGSELDTAFQQMEHWPPLIRQVRRVFSGQLTAAVGLSTAQKLTWWSELDLIGTEAYDPLSPPNSTVAGLVEAFQPLVAARAALAAKFSMPLLITEHGVQSRPHCWRRPYATSRPNPEDCSMHQLCYDMDCQATYYEAFFQAFVRPGYSWYAGNFWWLVRSDSTAGGTTDSSFTFLGKPAEAVLTKWYSGNRSSNARSAQPSHALETALPSPSPRQHSLPPPPTAPTTTRQQYRGVVFAGGLWSAPNTSLGTEAARQSLRNAVSVGTNAIELIPTWHFRNISSTDIYRMPTTPSDAELAAFIRYARSLGLAVSLSPLIDPDYTLPENFNASGIWIGPGRASLGAKFTPAEAAVWFANYRAMLLPYAQLAAETGVGTFVVSHELHALATNASYAAHWRGLVADVRAVFSGSVTVAFNGIPFFDDVARGGVPYLDALDTIGLDCYWPLHTPLPQHYWQSAPVSDIVAAWQPLVEQLAALSRANNNATLICTEVGYPSRPYGWLRPVFEYQLDPDDCSIWDQCVNLDTQAAAYEALFQALSPQPWFGGMFWWLWRSDPSAGGSTDDSYVPWMKPAADVLRRWWL